MYTLKRKKQEKWWERWQSPQLKKKKLTLTKKVVEMIQDKRLATQRRLGTVAEIEGQERAFGRQALLVKAAMTELNWIVVWVVSQV